LGEKCEPRKYAYNSDAVFRYAFVLTATLSFAAPLLLAQARLPFVAGDMLSYFGMVDTFFGLCQVLCCGGAR
jgi:hypothetical protein